jgi:hypothetical protein
MKAKQTAVEWLESEMLKPNLSMKDILEQAKEIEKQQIIDAWVDGNDNEAWEVTEYYAEQYYKEQFKNK